MSEYDGICWMGWVLIILYILGCCGMFWLISGSSAIYWILGLILAMICGIINGARKNNKQVVKEKEVPVFTDEDFMHCKIGEWVSR